MRKVLIKQARYVKRQKRVRGKVSGSATRPRLSVFKSNMHIYAQIIDDMSQKTLVSFSDMKLKKDKLKKVDVAFLVGEELAKLALKAKIKSIVFDRNGFRFHGRIKAVAEGARKGGLIF